MKIENDTARLITLNCADHQSIHLAPGVTDVDDDHWDDLKAQHGRPAEGDRKAGVLWSLLDSKDLVERGADYADPTADVVDDKADEPSGVPGKAADAIGTVSLCDDVDQLDAWKKGETRKTVLAAINDRIDDLLS